MRSPLGRSAGVAFVIQVAGVLLTYLLHILLARWMEAAGYGVYAYAIAWATLLATVGGLGLPLASLRFLSEYRESGDWALLRGAVRGLSAATLLGGLGVALLGSAVVALGAEKRPELWVAMAMVPALAMIALYTEMGRAVGSVTVSLGPSRLLRPLLTLGAVAAVVHVGRAASPFAALVATGIALLLVVLVQHLAVSHLLPSAARVAQPGYQFGVWFHTGRGLLIAAGLSLFLTQLDILAVGLLLDEREVGFYSAAAKTAAIVSFILYAINVAVAPKISALSTQGRLRELQVLTSKVARTAFWPTLALTVALFFLAAPILRFFGPEFTAATWELRVLTLGYLWSAGVGSVGYLLNLSGNERHNARVLFEAAILNVAGNAALVPWLGTLGAAASTTGTWVYVGYRLHRLAARHVGVNASIIHAWSGGAPDGSSEELE